MSEALLGPSFTITVVVPATFRIRLMDVLVPARQTGDLCESLQSRLSTSQEDLLRIMVVEQKLIHDGFQFSWDAPHVMDEPERREAVIISAEFNVLCKEEDFDLFYDFLQSDRYLERSTATFKKDLAAFLNTHDFPPNGVTIEVEFSEFGHG